MGLVTRDDSGYEGDDIFAALGELSPAPEEIARARTSAISQGLENTLPALLDTTISRALADRQEDAVRLSQAEARARLEAEGDEYRTIRGIGENGISERGLDILIARRRRQIQRETLINIGELGGLERVGLELVGSLPDPVNLVGVAAGARAATLGGAVARGAATETAVAAAIEPAYFALSRYAGEDYTLVDSAVNVAFSAVLGGAFGGAGYALSRVASPRERRQAAPVAARQAANNEAIDVFNAPDGLDRVPDAIVTRPAEGGALEAVELDPRTPQADVAERVQQDGPPSEPGESGLIRGETRSAVERLRERRPLRGPAATDAEARAVYGKAEVAPPENILPRSEEAKAIDEALAEAEAELLDPEFRASVEDELQAIDEAFTDGDTFVNTVRAGVECAVQRGIDDVV